MQIEELAPENWVVKICVRNRCNARIKNTDTRKSGVRCYTCFAGSYLLDLAERARHHFTLSDHEESAFAFAFETKAVVSDLNAKNKVRMKLRFQPLMQQPTGNLRRQSAPAILRCLRSNNHN